jgi:hypothetical protein
MPANLAIHRLSARTPARAQPLAARLALQALGADLEDALPRSLPPQSLLWLRRLQLQAPEAALLRPAPAAWRQDWIAAGRDRFDAALAQAARPALGPVPDSAPAVLFADAAEMLACLALAAQRGQLGRWWWRGLLARAWPQWQTAWAARPEAQAGAQRLLARLGQGGAAPGWMQDLPAERLPDMAAGAGLVAAGDARPPLSAAVVEPATGANPTPQTTGEMLAQAAAAPPELPRSRATARQSRLEAYVEKRVPAAQASRLLDEMPAPPVAAVQPTAATPEPYSAAPAGPALAAEEGATRSTTGADEPAAAPPDAPPVTAGSRRRHALATRAMQAESASRPPAAEPAPRPLLPPFDGVPPLVIGRASGLPSATGAAEPDAQPASEPWRHLPLAKSVAPFQATPDPQEPVFGNSGWLWPQAVPSRQAPLLFIVNALLEDGLYPDFTRPRDRGLPVPLWALLAALADAWRLPADGLAAALQQRCPDWHSPDAMPAAPGAPAGPWPEWLAAYARSLRRRLCRRLGLRPAAWPQALTLARPARLWLSEADWVAEFDLNTHDVCWRLAGLDRDPGWLPSAGCSLRFTFT